MAKRMAFRPELSRASGGPPAKAPRGPIIASPFANVKEPVLLSIDDAGRHHVMTADGLSYRIDPVCMHWADDDGDCRHRCQEVD